MKNRRFNEGIMYCIFGALLLLVTIPLVFTFLMIMFRVVFIIFGSLAVIGGLIQIKDSFKNKKTDEN